MKSLRKIAVLLLALGALWTPAGAASAAPAGHYRNFAAAIYIQVDAVRRLADPKIRDQEYARVAGQVRFDKVYIEVYRNRRAASDSEIESVKRFFLDHGVRVAGGVTLSSSGQGGQFATFDYEDPADRAACAQAVTLAARHFDEVILDDFFFFNTKTPADIAAKGARSWTQYRLETMRKAARDLVLAPARAANPRVRTIIKYPNWYEHFQGLGYDLDAEAKAFDAIYTGTETRDAEITAQSLQPYQSYLVFRYFDNVRPGGANLGGWVDTFNVRSVDRYAEQLWGTLFAKAPEITLFSWRALADPHAVDAGERGAWKDRPTSLDWSRVAAAYRPSGAGDAGPGWASVAAAALNQADAVAGKLGRPIGLASYKPYQSSGEDFLQDYLGGVGVPIELTPVFPTEARTVLLTEAAAADPDITARIKRQLTAGKRVIITSGLLRALQGRGIEDIVEWRDTGRTVALSRFQDLRAPGAARELADAGAKAAEVLFREIQFYTNDSWPLLRGLAQSRGFPILLMNHYAAGEIYLLATPENIGDLYSLPQPLMAAIRAALLDDMPVRIDAPPGVSLFAYDNGAFVVESFRPDAATVEVSLAGAGTSLSDAVTGAAIGAESTAAAQTGTAPRTRFAVTLEPHSFQAFSAGK